MQRSIVIGKKESLQGCAGHTGKGFRPLVMLKVDWQVGSPVFLTGLSNAHTFKTGSLGKSSYTASAQISIGSRHRTYRYRDQ